MIIPARPSRLLLIASLAAVVLVAPGCGLDGVTGGTAGDLEVSHLPPSSGQTLELSAGERFDLPTEPREAMLVIAKGSVSTNTSAPYKAEVVRVIDSPVFIDLDDNIGHEHWISRGELEDAEGNLLWTSRTNTLFQLLELLQLLLSQQDTVSLNAQQVYSLVRSQYPDLLEFALRIPTGIEGATDYVLRIPNMDGDLVEVMRVKLDTLREMSVPPRYEAEIATIVETGPSSDRIEITILGDGYSAAERGKFELDAQAVAERLFDTSPFREHREFFNVRTVWTPSAESGAGYDCLPDQPRCENRFRDTAFGNVFVIPAIADRFNIDVSQISDRVAMPVQIGKAFEVASLASFNEIIMISNTRKSSGFAGLYISLVTSFDNRVHFPDVAVHELGHSFGILGDEYMVQGDPCFYNEPRIPLPANIATLDPNQDLKWSYWLRDNTPIPTADGARNDYPIGAFRGAYNCGDLYRPSFNCMMKSSGQNFCPICAEQMVRRFYSVVDPTPNLPASVERIDAQTLRFEVPMWDDSDQLLLTWTLGGEQVATSPRYNLTSRRIAEAAPADSWVELIATVRDDSGYTRLDQTELVQTFTWWVKRAGAQ